MATVESIVKEVFALWEENETRVKDIAALTDCVKENTAHITHLAARLDALDALVQKWAGDAIGFGQKLDALEQAAKDQARNSNASAIAFNDRLDAVEAYRKGKDDLPSTVRGLRDQVDALEKRQAALEAEEWGQPPDEDAIPF